MFSGGFSSLFVSPAFRVVGIGFYLATAILIPVSLGIWLDGKLDSKPFFTVLMLIFGLIIGLIGAYRQLKEVTSNKYQKN